MNINVVLNGLGYICMSYALVYGKAGPIEAIHNFSVAIATLLLTTFESYKPCPLEIIGIVCGFIGVVFVVVKKDKK